MILLDRQLPNLVPEIVIDNNQVDNKVDIWSAGEILFQLLTHELPFKAQTFEELQLKISQKQLNRPSTIKDNLLWDLLTKLLEFDPNVKISASEALMHPYFTGQQADDEITKCVERLAQTAQAAKQAGDSNITFIKSNFS
ncbi:MAG: hypothetical protein EZS28_028623 [Streblomastix strix]|uniref:Protein kinase domain-containing protein n=1 Tax=Streblomastix strix TaxID=222440 RepID=A0A5J4V1D8_9EUKA|nr:MAG: hypothetical protein EZS28_028623 [Streblomastix strix]